jgi:hypothetical protein
VPLLAVYVTVVVVILVPTLTLPWWGNTEEFPYAQEVFRFHSGDFHQRFFDIPGTPLMFLSALLFAVPRWIVTRTSGAEGFALFSQQMDVLFVIMRLIEFAAFVVAGWLVYLTARRLVSKWPAGFAGTYLAASPVLYATIGHTRIEALGVLLVAAAIYTWARALESRSTWTFLLAGVIAGVAMAARFPLGLAALPVFALQAIAFPEPLRPSRAKPALVLALVAYAAIVLLGGALALLVRGSVFARNRLTDAYFITSPVGSYPEAFHVIRAIWVGLAGIVVCAGIAAVVPRWRRWFGRRLDSGLVPLLAGFPVGVVVGVPTLWAGANWFLGSINNFILRNQAFPQKWSVLETFSLDLFGNGGVGDVFTLRLPPDQPGALWHPILVVLFVVGVVACFTRRRRVLPFVALAIVIGLVAQLGKIQGARHIAGWLPWFALVIAVGFQWASAWVRTRHRVLVQAVAAIVLTAVLLQPVAYFSAPMNDHTIDKLPAQRKLNAWIAQHLPREQPVLFVCCTSVDAATIADWMRQNGVEIPPPRESKIWFGDRTSLSRQSKGYIVVDRTEYGPAYVSYYQHSNPAEVVDPYHDPRFERAARFPWGASSLDVFRYDLLKEVGRSSRGIHIVSATYGPPDRRDLQGNQTELIGALCEGRTSCSIVVAVGPEGDPAPAIGKAFSLSWRCGTGRQQVASVPVEALGKPVELRCPPPDGA